MLKPLGDRLLLKALEAPEKFGSLWLPPQAQRDYVMDQGEVVAVGADVQDERLQPGVRVIVKKFGGAQLDEGRRQWCVFEGQVMAILEDGEV